MEAKITDYDPLEGSMSELEKDVWSALKIFRKRFGIFIVNLLDPKGRGNWETDFYQRLYDKKRKSDRKQASWNMEKDNHPDKQLVDLLDYQYFEIFAENSKGLMEPYFGSNRKRLPSWLGEITEVRNTVAHFNSHYLNDKDIMAAWLVMGRIADHIKDSSLQNALDKIKERESLKKILSEYSGKEKNPELNLKTKSQGENKHTVRNLIVCAVIVVLLVVAYLFRNYFTNNSTPPVGNTNTTPATAVKIDTVKIIVPPVSDNSVKNNPKIPVQPVKVEDYGSYVNSSLTSSSGKTDVSVTIIDEEGNIVNTVSNSIADIYKNSGKTANFGLLKNEFAGKPEFKELFEGNSDIIGKLKLSDYTGNMAVGKIKYKYSKGTLTNGTVVCNATLSMCIISTSNKSISRSFDVTAVGNDVSESSAKETALGKLLTQYNNQYTSL